MKNKFRIAIFFILELLIPSKAFSTPPAAIFICNDYHARWGCDCASLTVRTYFIIPENYSNPDINIIGITVSNSVPNNSPTINDLKLWGPYTTPQDINWVETQAPCYHDIQSSTTKLLVTSNIPNYSTAGGYYYCEFTINTYDFYVDVNYLMPNTCTPCKDCLPSFSPQPDSTYIISAWISQDMTPTTTTFDIPNSSNDPYLTVGFGVGNPTDYHPSGQIIDGWQRLEGEFTVPSDAATFSLTVNNGSTANAWFDDIRIYPKNGSMKTYVFDPVTLRLDAELDERNYATIYEYDEEGHLTRVKKETERGVMTIQENKTASAK